MTARFAVRCAIVFPDNAGRRFRPALKSAQSRETSDARTSGDFPFHRESVRTRPVPGRRPTGESCAAHDENYQPTAHRASPKPRLRISKITSLRFALVKTSDVANANGLRQKPAEFLGHHGCQFFAGGGIQIPRQIKLFDDVRKTAGGAVAFAACQTLLTQTFRLYVKASGQFHDAAIRDEFLPRGELLHHVARRVEGLAEQRQCALRIITVRAIDPIRSSEQVPVVALKIPRLRYVACIRSWLAENAWLRLYVRQ